MSLKPYKSRERNICPCLNVSAPFEIHGIFPVYLEYIEQWLVLQFKRIFGREPHYYTLMTIPVMNVDY